jgi:ankyrin repeat protein
MESEVATSLSTRFLEAVEAGNIAIVTSLLQRRPFLISSTTEAEKTALHVAASRGHSTIFWFLCDQGADVNAHDALQNLPLHDAGHPDIVNCILERDNRHIDSRNLKGATPLISAAARGNVSALSCLIRHGASVDFKDFEGKAAISYAAELGHVSTLAALLSHNEEMAEMLDGQGYTPLWYASRTGQIDAVRILFRNRILDYRPTQLGKTHKELFSGKPSALEIAARMGWEQIVSFFIEQGRHIKPCHQFCRALWEAASRGHTTIVQALIDAGADQDYCDP